MSGLQKMGKNFAVYDTTGKRFLEFFAYPIQAERYIEKRKKGSKRFIVLDIRKKNE